MGVKNSSIFIFLSFHLKGLVESCSLAFPKWGPRESGVDPTHVGSVGLHNATAQREGCVDHEVQFNQLHIFVLALAMTPQKWGALLGYAVGIGLIVTTFDAEPHVHC